MAVWVAVRLVVVGYTSREKHWHRGNSLVFVCYLHQLRLVLWAYSVYCANLRLTEQSYHSLRWTHKWDFFLKKEEEEEWKKEEKKTITNENQNSLNFFWKSIRSSVFIFCMSAKILHRIDKIRYSSQLNGVDMVEGKKQSKTNLPNDWLNLYK